MIKQRLFTPGPTDVPPEVLNEMAKPMIHHRTPEFREILGAVLAGLKNIFRTEGDVMVIPGSGTAGMEAAIACAVPRDRKVLVSDGGKFGERWVKVAKAYGLDVDEVKLEWGTPLEAATVKDKLAGGQYGAVVTVHSETSTATACDLRAIAEVVRETDAVLIVDAITACGAIPLETDAWGVDVVACGSQKAFMLPPGLAMLSVSDKAWKVVDSQESRCLYLDLKAYRKSLAKNDTPYTGPVSLVRALRVAVDMINAVGIETVWSRVATLAKAMRAAARPLGMKVFSRQPSDSVTGLLYPAGVDDGFRKLLKKKYGCSVAGGQNQLEGKVCRISHMGYVDPLDTLGLIGAMELALAECGVKVAIGEALAAAANVLKDWK